MTPNVTTGVVKVNVRPTQTSWRITVPGHVLSVDKVNIHPNGRDVMCLEPVVITLAWILSSCALTVRCAMFQTVMKTSRNNAGNLVTST